MISDSPVAEGMHKRGTHTESDHDESLVRIWYGPHETVCMPEDSVHLWCQALDAVTPFNHVFYSVLSEQERRRANAFYFASDRMHFVASHGFVRYVLAAYLECRPEALHFDSGPYGKPFVRQPEGNLLEFNLSHSRGMLLLAISQGDPVGVDIEGLRPEASLLLIAEQHFHAYEFQCLKALPDTLCCDAFFRCWTYKESVMKYCGDGLQRPMHTIPVPRRYMEGEKTWHASSINGMPIIVKNLRPAPDFMGALAARRVMPRIEHWRWSPPLGFREMIAINI